MKISNFHFVMKKHFKILIFAIVFLLKSTAIWAQTVSLNYPKNDFITDNNTLELCWNYKTSHLYEIEVSTDQNFNAIFFTSNNISSGKMNISLPNSNTSYFWRVRSTAPVLTPWSNSYNFFHFNPSTINNLSLWLKADTALVLSSNNTVLTWNDLSINQYAFTQPTLGKQPTPTQGFYNNKKALSFDGNDFFEYPNFNFGSSNTVFIVGKKNPTTE